MKLYNKQEILILEETQNFYRAHYANEPEHKSFFVPKSQVTEAHSKSQAARLEIQKRPLAPAKPVTKVIEAGILSPVFVEAVKRSNYKIRVLYPPEAEQSIVDSFRKAGVSLPADIRPQAVGKRKPDAQAPRSWSATVTFPSNVVLSGAAPDGTVAVSGKPDLSINSKRSVVLALLQAGLVINDYAKA